MPSRPFESFEIQKKILMVDGQAQVQTLLDMDNLSWNVLEVMSEEDSL